MVRTYKRKSAPVDKEKIKAAILAVRQDKMSIRQTAKKFGIKNSTLQGWLKNTTAENEIADRRHGRTTVNIVFLPIFYFVPE